MYVESGDLSVLVELMDSVGPRVGARIDVGFRKVAFEVEGTGKVYAAVDTGTMRASIGTDFDGSAVTGYIEATIGPTVDYAIYVEQGTSRMDPQPFMGPALDRHGWELERLIDQVAGDPLR